jgi:hypothetical protein
MVRIWSELPGARLREQVVDLATAVWVVLWGAVAWSLYQALAAFAESGRLIRTGGQALVDGGRDLGNALAGIPLVGEGLRDVATNAIAGAGSPIVGFGDDVEEFILLVAAVLTLLLVLVTLVPWLSRYVPWRWERLRRTRAGHRAIRQAPELPATQLQALLALRAITRLDYRELLTFTPDPLGDWAAGRHDRLARAELASVGLRPAAGG